MTWKKNKKNLLKRKAFEKNKVMEVQRVETGRRGGKKRGRKKGLGERGPHTTVDKSCMGITGKRICGRKGTIASAIDVF